MKVIHRDLQQFYVSLACCVTKNDRRFQHKAGFKKSTLHYFKNKVYFSVFSIKMHVMKLVEFMCFHKLFTIPLCIVLYVILCFLLVTMVTVFSNIDILRMDLDLSLMFLYVKVLFYVAVSCDCSYVSFIPNNNFYILKSVKILFAILLDV